MGKHDPHKRAPLTTEPAPWHRVVLVCGKCVEKQSREELRGDIKRALKQAGMRDVRVVLTGCFDLCPDDGVTFVLGSDLAGAVPRLRVLANHADAERLLPLLQDARDG